MFAQNSILRSWFLQVMVTAILVTAMNVSAVPPSWWHEPDATGRKVIDPTVTNPNNYGPANIGQAKYMVRRAIETLRIHAPSVANDVESDLVGVGKIIPSWDIPLAGSAAAKDQYSPLQIGQLKALADPFYRRLNTFAPVWLEAQLQANLTKDAANSANYFPWTSSTADDQNRAIATIGQLKAVFSLNFEALQNPNVVVNSGNMLRLNVVGKMKVRVTDRNGLAKPGVNLQFNRIAGDGAFAGGVTDLNKITNSAGEVSIDGQYSSPEGDLIRVSLHTAQGTQNAWLPANVSLPEHIIRAGFGGNNYQNPLFLGIGPDGPPIAGPDPDPQGPVELVDRFENHIRYDAVWESTTQFSGSAPTVQTKLIGWDPADGIRTITSTSSSGQSSTTLTVGSTFSQSGSGYEINGYHDISGTSENSATATMDLWAVLPTGFNEVEIEHGIIWADNGFSGTYGRRKVKLSSISSTEIKTSSRYQRTASVLGPFISYGPTTDPGYDNVLRWNHLSDNLVPISNEETKSLLAQVMVDKTECGYVADGVKWNIKSSNPNVFVSIYHVGTGGMGRGEVPSEQSFRQLGTDFLQRGNEIRIKVKDGESGNIRSNITLELLDKNDILVVQKQFVVEARSSSNNDNPPKFNRRSGSTKTIAREESSGPRHRKIALNGRPLADEKPQAEDETDEADEETYVDALTRELRHSTSDMYVPVPASDLSLAVKRNIASEIWNPVSDLLPSEDPTLAFGPAWRTNVGAHIMMIEQVVGIKLPDGSTAPLDPASSSQTLGHLVATMSEDEQEREGFSQSDPNYAFVTDEDGASHRFMIDNRGPTNETRRFVPAPGAVNDRSAHEMSLKWKSPTILEFKRKHGNTLVYERCIDFRIDRVRRNVIAPQYGIGLGGNLPDSATEFGSSVPGGHSGDPGVQGSRQFQAYNYFRLISVTDRLGNKMIYTYDASGSRDLIPKSIHVEGRPELAIQITSSEGKVRSVSDPKGNVTSYVYHPNGTLESARVDGVPTSTYGYKRWEETDYRKDVRNMRSISLLQWAILGGNTQSSSSFQYGEMVQHWDVDEISDANNNKYKFHYKPDASHMMFEEVNFAGPSSGTYSLGTSLNNATLQDMGPSTAMIPIAGYPPDVTRIDLPGGDFVEIGSSADVPPSPGENGVRRSDKHTTVIDAEGHRRTYYWDSSVTIPVDRAGLGYTVGRNAAPPSELRNMFRRVFGDETHYDPDDGVSYAPPQQADTTAVHTFYTRMSIEHDKGGVETYGFSLAAGGALKSVQDFSGNMTKFYFGSSKKGVQKPSLIAQLPGGITPPFSSKPTQQMDAEGNIIWYTYGHYEMLSRIENGGIDQIRDFDVDTWGRSRKETVISVQNSETLAETQIHYDFTPSVSGAIGAIPAGRFLGFVTKKTVKNVGHFKTTDDPSWVQDLTTLYEADSLGRIAREATDMNGNGLIDAADLITTYTYDRNGNKLSATDPAGYTTWFHYDKRNRLVGIVNPDGTEKRTVYDIRGKKVLQYDEKGNATGYSYDVRGRMTRSVRDMNGNLAVGSNGLLTGVDTGIDIIEEKVYNKVDSVIRTRDPRGYISVTDYDHLQRPVKTILPGGSRAPGQVPSGNSTDEVTSFYYDGENPGASCFDTSGFKPTRIVDPRGYTSILEYDALYRPTVSRIQYSLSPALFAQKENFYVYALKGLLSSVEEPRQPVNSAGIPTGETIAGGRVVEYDYDGLLRISKVQERSLDEPPGAKQSEEQSVYTATGLLRQTSKKLGALALAITDYKYDRAGRVTEVTSPAADGGASNRPFVSTVYDKAGLVIKTTDPRGAVTEFVHDARGRQVQQILPEVLDASTNASGIPLVTTEYDNVGNVVKVTNPLGYSTATQYDAANRATLAKAPAYLDTQTGTMVTPMTVNSYDLAGNILTVTDPRGSVTSNKYDARGRLTETGTNPTVPYTSTSHADDQIVRFAWDKAGNKVGVTDGATQHTSFDYDGLNRLTATNWDYTNSSRKKTETTEYDALVQSAKVDPLGCRTVFGYGDRLLLTRSVSAGLAPDVPSLDESRTYDHAGRLLTVTDAGDNRRNVTYVYDHLDRVTSETSAGFTHSYGYDLAGNRTTVSYPHTSRSMVSVYDHLNRLTKITETGGSPVTSRETNYRYDLASNVLQREQANTSIEFNGYDPLGRRIFQRTLKGNIPVSLFAYSHDPVGNVTRVEERFSSSTIPDRNVINVYDRQNRLKTEQADNLTSGGAVNKTTLTTYTYSKANNRTAKNLHVTVGGSVVSNDTETFIYGSNVNGKNSNQLHSHTKGGVTSIYNYDANGNRKERWVSGVLKDTYKWDARNRLVSVIQESPYKTHLYDYDYRARRILRDEAGAGGEQTIISFSGGTSVFEKVGAATRVEYIRGSDYGGGIGGVMYSIRSGVPSFNAYNGRGDVVAKTNSAGAVTWQASYEAFGTRTAEHGTNLDRQKANTKEEDPTGLLNEGFRYRDLATGVFISRDPLGFVDGPNVYTYVNQNPWTKFDPLGLFEGGAAGRYAHFKEAQMMSQYTGNSVATEMKKVEIRDISLGSHAFAGQVAGAAKLVAKTAAYGGSAIQGKLGGPDPIVYSKIDKMVDGVVGPLLNVDPSDIAYRTNSAGVEFAAVLAGAGNTVPRESNGFKHLPAVKPRSMDKIDPVPTQTLQSARKDKLENEITYLYVVNPKGDMSVAPRGDPRSGTKHTQLNGGEAAVAAGELRIGPDKKLEFNSSTGRYSAQSPEASAAVKKSLEEKGYDPVKVDKELE